jgi:hypothetical protein
MKIARLRIIHGEWTAKDCWYGKFGFHVCNAVFSLVDRGEDEDFVTISTTST